MSQKTGVKPRYLEIKDAICSKIRKDGMHSGDRFLTVRQLAHEYKTSIATATKVVAVLQSEGILIAQKGRGIFVGHSFDPSPATALALVTSPDAGPEHPFVAEWIRGLEEARGADFDHVMVLRVSGKATSLRENLTFVNLANSRAVCGMLVLNRIAPEDYYWLINQGIPVVIYGAFMPADVWSIDLNPRNVAHEIFDFLVKMRHRSIAQVIGQKKNDPTCHTGSDGSLEQIKNWLIPAKAIWSSVRQEFEQKGLIDSSPQLIMAMDYWEAGAARRIADWLLDLQPRPTAVIIGEEKIAWDLVLELRRRGTRVPEDLSVISIGSVQAPKELTLWEMPLDRAARVALRMMRAQRRGEPVENRREQLASHLRFGQTAGINQSA